MSDFEMRAIHGLIEIVLSVTLLSWISEAPRQKWRTVAGWASLALLFPMFLLESGPLLTLLRFVWRVLCYLGFLAIGRHLPLNRAMAIASVAATAFLAADNIMVSPAFYWLRADVPPVTPFPLLNDFLVKCVFKYVIIGIALLIVFKLIPFRSMTRLTIERGGVIVIILVVVVYTKEIAYELGMKGIDPAGMDLSVFVVVTNTFLLAFLVLMERAIFLRGERAEAAMREIASELRLAAFRERLTADEETRALRHDLKNHILALRQLATESGDSPVLKYLDSMEESAQAALRRFSTGSALLDGLLSQKAKDAQDAEVSFEADLSAPILKKMNEADLCSLFGNLLDNAIEATRQQADKRLRYVHVSMRRFANQLTIFIENGFSGEIHRRDGLPTTTKSGSTHGYGLRNVRSIARKYGGEVTFEHARTEFIVTVRLDTDYLQ